MSLTQEEVAEVGCCVCGLPILDDDETRGGQMAAVDLLQHTRAFLTPRERWAQGAAAFDEGGKIVRADSPSAICFCVLGALNHAFFVHGSDNHELYQSPLDYIRRAIDPHSPFVDVVHWNDHTTRTHADVLKVLDKAIELAKADT